jgi:hypothetical protein
MKKYMILSLMLLFVCSNSFAFLYEVKVLTREEIKKISNDQILDFFKNAVIERKASETFHGKAGFTPKEYESYKALLGFIIDLREEMKTRELEPSPIEDWLR